MLHFPFPTPLVLTVSRISSCCTSSHQLNSNVCGRLYLQHWQATSSRLFGLRCVVEAAHTEDSRSSGGATEFSKSLNRMVERYSSCVWMWKLVKCPGSGRFHWRKQREQQTQRTDEVFTSKLKWIFWRSSTLEGPLKCFPKIPMYMWTKHVARQELPYTA